MEEKEAELKNHIAWAKEKTRLAKESLGTKSCPNCSGTDLDTIRQTATFALPESTYTICNECGAKSNPQ